MKMPAAFQEAMDEVQELQIAPLIDCVFQLLIYFMVSASLQKTEADLGISLPGSVMQSQPSQMPDEQIVEIDAKGKVTLNGRGFDVTGDPEMPELTATLIRYRQASEAARNKAMVTIMCADDTVHQRTIDVMNACAAARIKNVTFSSGE
jgi:biopolymer transport protein ExbD